MPLARVVWLAVAIITITVNIFIPELVACNRIDGQRFSNVRHNLQTKGINPTYRIARHVSISMLIRPQRINRRESPFLARIVPSPHVLLRMRKRGVAHALRPYMHKLWIGEVACLGKQFAAWLVAIGVAHRASVVIAGPRNIAQGVAHVVPSDAVSHDLAIDRIVVLYGHLLPTSSD